MFPGGKFPGEAIFRSWYPILAALLFGVIYAIRAYFKGAQCRSLEEMKGKTVIITGANSGIGLETARELAKRGARVILACRDESKGKAAMNEIKQTNPESNLLLMSLDLASFKSIKEFAQKVIKSEREIHVLINNAGILRHPQQTTEDGYEIHFQVNYLGHFLLTHLLLDKLKASSLTSSFGCRVVNLTALGYRLGNLQFDDDGNFVNKMQETNNDGDAYAQSKLALLLFTRELAKNLQDSKVTVNAVMPGVVNTALYRNMPFRKSSMVAVAYVPIFWFLTKSSKDGAQTSVHCAIAAEEKEVSGKYYSECKLSEVEENAKDDDAARQLWKLSLKLTKLNEEGNVNS